MQPEPTSEPAIVRLSRLSVAGSGSDENDESEHWTVYGVDACGEERVYVEHWTREEHERWRASDPLWREAQRGLIDHLLENPGTRDLVIQLNAKAALEAGDTHTAAKLAAHLSEAAKARLRQASSDAADAD